MFPGSRTEETHFKVCTLYESVFCKISDCSLPELIRRRNVGWVMIRGKSTFLPFLSLCRFISRVICSCGPRDFFSYPSDTAIQFRNVAVCVRSKTDISI